MMSHHHHVGVQLSGFCDGAESRGQSGKDKGCLSLEYLQ